MTHWISWYITITLLGWLAFPVVFRLMGGLKDRGYLVSRSVGLLIWGYCYWLLASLGAIPNNPGGLLFSAAILAAFSVWSLSGNRWQDIWKWLRTQKRIVISGELLFLAAFAGWAIVRAANPEAVGTEKPMELAFINAILRSPTFPPHDPWLSGYAISYYYFGYVLTAMLAMITGTPGGVAFNLGIALVFALSACGAYGLVFNLLSAKEVKKDEATQVVSVEADENRKPQHTIAALLGPLFVLLVSNLEGFLDVLHNAGLFWRRNIDGTLTSAFWKWLDIQDLSSPPSEPFSLIPGRFWWWWRASRVLQDYDLKGGPREIIDEFPFFSYLLADLHPHVLAMPFAFLAIALALNIFLSSPEPSTRGTRLHIPKMFLGWGALFFFPIGLAAFISGALAQSVGLVGIGTLILATCSYILWQAFHSADSKNIEAILTDRRRTVIGLDIAPHLLLISAIALGAMAFLNTWDFPVYIFIFAGAYAIKQVMQNRKSWGEALVDLVLAGGVLGLGGIIFYLPFYLGFSSQAGGILPNLIFPTRGAHFWVMFAPLLIPMICFLLYHQDRNGGRQRLWKGFAYASVIMLGLWLVFLLIGWGITLIPERGQQLLSTLAADTTGELMRGAIYRRLSMPGTWITQLIMLGLSISLLSKIRDRRTQDQEATRETHSGSSIAVAVFDRPDVFVLLLILTGLLLVLVPEFFYLLDMFGWRMNTIFKFYFSAWLVWGIAAAYCTISLSHKLKGWWNGLFQLVISLILLAGLTYPMLSILDKTNNLRPSQWTLDSTAYFALENPDEKAAIEWLKNAPFGIVAEAVPAAGGSYTSSARISTLSGMPAVLGWVGHENQWRGGNQVLGSRQSDLERLFCSRDWDEAKMILDQYQIRYIVIGNLERTVYQPNSGLCPTGLMEAKFQQHLDTVFSQNSVSLYEYSSAKYYD